MDTALIACFWRHFWTVLAPIGAAKFVPQGQF
jgi:hypothetical protein